MPNPRVPNYILTKTKKALTLAGGDCIGQDELIEAQAELADVLHWMCGKNQACHVAIAMELPQFFEKIPNEDPELTGLDYKHPIETIRPTHGVYLEACDPSEFSNKELLEVVETHKPKS